MELSCKKCRTALLLGSELLESHALTNPAKCTSYFAIELPSQFKLNSASNDGKIMCPICNSRVGNWCYSGSQCSCGDWVTPSFQFHLSKLDKQYKNVSRINAIVDDVASTSQSADDYPSDR
jgi:hypothetical protein